MRLRPERTRFLDDTERVLNAAAEFGIREEYGMSAPPILSAAHEQNLSIPASIDFMKSIPQFSTYTYHG